MGRQFSLVLASFLVINIALMTNADTPIPEKEDEVDSWFQNAIKPASESKGAFESNVKEAESGGIETIDVRQDGSGKFKTITDAVKHIKIGNTKRAIIAIGPGEYREKVKIESLHPYITLYGTDTNNRPTITYAGTVAEFGTVDDSATLIVESDYFVAANIIVSNSAPKPDGKKKGAQATAVRISGEKAAFYNCKFTAFQDTVCDDSGNHFFKDCYIEGSTDIIYGEARSLYLNTELHVLSDDPMAMITAHARENKDGVGGYSFVHCHVTGNGSHALLGRAWSQAARVVFSYCTISDVVKPEGWSNNSNLEAQKTVFFGEYKNTGPGVSSDKRVKYSKQLKDEEAKTFIALDYIDAAKWLLPPPKF